MSSEKGAFLAPNIYQRYTHYKKTPIKQGVVLYGDYPRSAIIVFRFSFVLANFQDKRHTLIRVRLHGLACAPRATISLPGWLRSRGTRDPIVLAAVTG